MLHFEARRCPVIGDRFSLLPRIFAKSRPLVRAQSAQTTAPIHAGKNPRGEHLHTVPRWMRGGSGQLGKQGRHQCLAALDPATDGADVRFAALKNVGKKTACLVVPE